MGHPALVVKVRDAQRLRRRRARRWAAALLAVCSLLARPGVASAPASAAPAPASACPNGGEGGPFLRICSTNVFSNGPRFVGAHAFIVLPCGTTDLVRRDYVTGLGNKPTGTTTDEGYAYFAFYAPGDEMEVGYFHNPNLAGDPYTLYVRHGLKSRAGVSASTAQPATGFWTAPSGTAVPCGSTVSLQVLLGYENTGIVIQLTGNAMGASKQYLYEFRLNVPNTVMYPNQVPISFNGQATYPAGTGSIAPLDEPGWANGCPTCSIAMITAIAQNGAYGIVPAVPFEDGAAFGPVDWERATLEDGNAEVPWAPGQTAKEVRWLEGFSRVHYTGAPPSYSVVVAEPCETSDQGPDRWSC